jgi:hypothetical protein
VACTNKTSFNGVSKKGKKFQAWINSNGKREHHGYFIKARDAAMWRTMTRTSKNHRPEKYLNFPAGMPIEDQEPDEV